MGNVVMHNVVSVDGFIADENDQVGPLFEWYGNGEHTLAGDRKDTTGALRVSKASIDYVEPMWAARSSRPASWTRWRWTWCRWCSGQANDTSAASRGSIYWRIPTWSSRVSGCYI